MPYYCSLKYFAPLPRKTPFLSEKEIGIFMRNFDFDYFLQASAEECQKILINTFAKEIKNIKNAWEMKKVTIDSGGLYKAILEITK